MAFRFWRRIRLAPGVTLNLSKSAASLSFGPRGAKYTISPRGNRATAGIPGTGLFYTVRDPGAGRGQERGASAPMVRARDRLTLGFFQRLITPAAERAFVDGLKALNEGDDSEALVLLDRSASLADAAWLAGMLHLKSENFEQAERCLLDALERRHELDSLFSKYGVNATISLPITPEISAHVRPRERGTLLALVEVYQLQGRSGDALIRLDQLLDLDKSDPVVLLSFAELALDHPNPEHLRRIVELSASVENETPVHTALLLYRARALVSLGLPDAAIDVLTLALRRRKDRPDELLRQVRYERALLYDGQRRQAQARREFERIYAEDPGFEDVAERLEL
jgi:tetratricopeptide (TPR) repeat protein